MLIVHGQDVAAPGIAVYNARPTMLQCASIQAMWSTGNGEIHRDVKIGSQPHHFTATVHAIEVTSKVRVKNLRCRLRI